MVDPQTIQALQHQKKEFWITQVLVVMSTVMGVFLAAEEGFSAAVRFDKVSRELSAYNLQQALRSELDDNIEAVEQFYERHQRTGLKRQELIALDTFVWEAMRENPVALELPIEILSGTRRFYKEVGDALSVLDAQIESGRYKLVSGDFFRRVMGRAFERLKSTKTSLLPELDRGVARAKERLIHYGALEK